MKQYELNIITKSELPSDYLDGLRVKIETYLSREGGVIEKFEDNGSKRLAYEIKKHSKGRYLFVLFKGLGRMNADLQKFFEIDDHILRYHLISV